MRKLVVSEFVSMDGVMQAPGGKDEDRDGGFQHGGWTIPYWHDDIGTTFFELMQGCDGILLGRRTYVTHAEAFEPIFQRPELARMTEEGVRIVYIPRLSCLTSMRATGLSCYDAASNKPDKNGQPMPPMRQFMVKTWLRRMEEAFVETGVAEWLP